MFTSFGIDPVDLIRLIEDGTFTSNGIDPVDYWVVVAFNYYIY